MGDGVFGTDSDTPVRVDGAPAFSAMTLGPGNTSYACGLTTAGNVYCWGSNQGRWGNGGTSASPVPVLSAGVEPPQ
jgi:hypothetical protein